MSSDSSTQEDVSISRMTAAEAADLLRDYEREFEHVGEDDGYAECIDEVAAELEKSLSGKS
jgi:hypothetical protein